MSQEISGHTKGKWTVCTDNVVQIGTTYFVAPISPDVHMSAADARLIAAAPDLLAALDLAVREMRAVRDDSTGGIPNDIIALLPEAIEMADAAIAKARA
jgi:hypothetical protein